jgi:hypothetical protein
MSTEMLGPVDSRGDKPNVFVDLVVRKLTTKMEIVTWFRARLAPRKGDSDGDDEITKGALVLLISETTG